MRGKEMPVSGNRRGIDEETGGVSVDRKVTQGTFTRSISIGRIIPKDWEYVRLTILEVDNDRLVVQIRRLV